MPLKYWRMCVEEMDHRYARKTVDKEVEETEQDVDEWFRIYDTHIALYGLNKKYMKLLNAIRKKALLEVRWVITRDPFLETLIAIEEENIAAIKRSQNKGVSISKTLIYLSKWIGHHIKETEITAREYHDLLEEYGKQNKKE